MTIGLVIRSFLALLLGVAVTMLGLSHATILPRPAADTALSPQSEVGSGGLYQVNAAPPTQPSRQHKGPATKKVKQQVIQPGAEVSLLPRVPGHIFYTAPTHNLYFVTGRHPRKQFTGDGTTVAPALSADGSELAWVKLMHDFSDIYVTPLKYGPKGSVIPLPATWVTQDEHPPVDLMASPPPPGYQPSYEWWSTKPSFTPDGRHLVYISNRPGYDPSNPVKADGAIWEQGVTGTITNAVQLATPTTGTGGDDSPEWRPHDPAVFIYTNYYHDNQVSEAIIQAAMAVTGTAPAPGSVIGLTPHGVTAELPAWSPDGRYIAFVEDHNSKTSDIEVMPFHRPGYPNDYNKAQIVAHGAPYVTQPFWSPDGDYLGYLTSSGQDFTLVIRHVTRDAAGLHFGPPIAIPQAKTLDAGYRPAWGP